MKSAVLALVTLLPAAVLLAQQNPAAQQDIPRELKNVRVLKGMSPSELIRTMRFMSASLGVGCDFCHVSRPGGERDFASDDKEEKRTGRDMIRLVMDTNTKYFKGRTMVSCTTCHHGVPHPVSVPVLPIPTPAHTDDHMHPAEEAGEARAAVPTRDDLVSRYAKALGDVDARAIASIELKGSREMERSGSVPFDVMIVDGKTRVSYTMPEGEMVSVVTGSGGWARDARGTRVIPPVQLDSMRQILGALRLPLPGDVPAQGRIRKDKIGGRDVWVLVSPTGTTGRQSLSFDAATGLVVRRLALTFTPVGNVPQQTDFDDYRDVGGFKLPFTVRFDSVDRRASRVMHYTEITPNARIDEKVFVQPQ